MNILIDINHPAHVHYFRNLIHILSKKGHRFLIIARQKEISQQLLQLYNLPYISRGAGKKTILGRFFYLFRANQLIFREAKRFKPDLFLSFSSPYAAQVAFLLRKPHIAFDDTEHAHLTHWLYRPFTKKVFTPTAYRHSFGTKQIRFEGYMELAYLHPNYFTPDKKIFQLLEIQEDTPYVILRFVAWNAHHDRGHRGISSENKIHAVKEFSKYARVFISSETKLPDALKKYRLNIPFHQIHHALHFARLLYGESATMASEAAVLGTPAVFLDNTGRGYTDELEKKYGLVSNFTESPSDQLKSIEKGISILRTYKSNSYISKRKKLLSQTIDLSSLMLDVVLKNEPISLR